MDAGTQDGGVRSGHRQFRDGRGFAGQGKGFYPGDGALGGGKPGCLPRTVGASGERALPGGRVGLCKAVCRGKIWAAPLKGQNAHKEWAHSIFLGAVPNGSFPRLVPAGVSEYNMFCFLGRFYVEKALPAVGSRRSLRRHKNSVFALFNAGSGEP